jgi:hypothetical protein
VIHSFENSLEKKKPSKGRRKEGGRVEESCSGWVWGEDQERKKKGEQVP